MAMTADNDASVKPSGRRPRELTLFEQSRSTYEESIDLTIASLKAYGPQHRHWAIAYSGGKDSTALVTVVIWLIETGQIEAPESLTVLYADTRMELPPLAISAGCILADVAARGFDARTVVADLDKRFLVYMLGRGVPPPNNNTLRWCTRQIKVDPMHHELRRLHSERGKVLMLTGVRQGESAVRDGRIAMSCGRDGGECGQGWYQESLPGALCDTLAPLLHWRVCHVWDWLDIMAPSTDCGSWDTSIVAEAYGGDEAVEMNARTGCNGCPLATKDTALDGLLARYPDRWGYLEPLRELRPLYRRLREPNQRLRKQGGEMRKDGTPVANQFRMGPLTMEARRSALAEVLDLQDRINVAARKTGRPEIDMLNHEEVARIHELIEADTWPQRWSGDEPRADEPFGEGLLATPTIFDFDEQGRQRVAHDG